MPGKRKKKDNKERSQVKISRRVKEIDAAGGN